MTTSRRRLLKAAGVLVCTGGPLNALSQQRRPSLSDPTPDDAREFAATAVKLAYEIEGKVLDYSPGSLAHVDTTVLSFRESGKSSKDVGATLVVFGCYVGEVIVRGIGAEWVRPSERERELGFSLLGVRTKSGAFWNPIGKVFKLLANGKEDSVEYMYSVARSGEP